MDLKKAAQLNVENLSKSEIEELKETFGKVYRVSVCGHKYLIRPIFGVEYSTANLKALKAQNKTAEYDEAVTNIGLLAPKPDPEKGGWAAMEAGIPSALSLLIQAKSGFIIPGGLEELPMSVENLYEEVPPVTPSDEEIAELKSRTSVSKVFKVVIGDRCFILRPLLRQEWRNMLSMEVEDRDVSIASKATMWPKAMDYDKELCGVADTIAQFVLTVSGFEPPTSVEEL